MKLGRADPIKNIEECIKDVATLKLCKRKFYIFMIKSLWYKLVIC